MADEAEAEAPKAKGSKLVLILLIVIVVLLLALGGFAAWYFLLREAPAAQADQPVAQQTKLEALYVKIRTKSGKPYFIANFTGDQGSQRFLQVYVEARTRNPDVQKALEKHMPLIVSELQVLFSSQKLRDLQTDEGRQKLHELALEKIQAIMQEEVGEPGVEAVFFTNFVMQ